MELSAHAELDFSQLLVHVFNAAQTLDLSRVNVFVISDFLVMALHAQPATQPAAHVQAVFQPTA